MGEGGGTDNNDRMIVASFEADDMSLDPGVVEMISLPLVRFPVRSHCLKKMNSKWQQAGGSDHTVAHSQMLNLEQSWKKPGTFSF